MATIKSDKKKSTVIVDRNPVPVSYTAVPVNLAAYHVTMSDLNARNDLK